MPGQAFGTTQTTLDDQPSQQAVSRGVARPQSLLRAPPSWIRVAGAEEPGNSQQHASNGRRLHGVKPTAVRSTDSSPVARRYSASSAISMRPTATARLTRSVQLWRRGPPRDRCCPQAGSAGGGLGAGRAIRPGCRRRGAFDPFDCHAQVTALGRTCIRQRGRSIRFLRASRRSARRMGTDRASAFMGTDDGRHLCTHRGVHERSH